MKEIRDEGGREEVMRTLPRKVCTVTVHKLMSDYYSAEWSYDEENQPEVGQDHQADIDYALSGTLLCSQLSNRKKFQLLRRMKQSEEIYCGIRLECLPCIY